MKQSLLPYLRCPACHGELSSDSAQEEIESGTLTCTACAKTYPIVESIPRFVDPENYASNFGFQWNRFRQTQLDSHTGVPISRQRFLAQTGWTSRDLEGRLVLDAGCGAGRFAEIALSLGANVIAIDYSSAVQACRANLGANPRLHVVQADIYRLPFAPETFDFVYSLGVLQHTPDVERACRALIPLAKRGGRITVDFYRKRWTSVAEPKYWLRPFTTRMRQQRLFSLVERWAPRLLRASRAAARVPVAGKVLRRLIPVANYEGIYPLNERQLQEWAILDTFDWLGPRFDHPQTPETVRRWLESEGLADVDVEHVHHLTGRARRPAG